MERKQIQVTTNYVVCPNCANAAGGIDHLKGSSHDLRWCCEHCGYQFAFVINKEGVVENIRLTGEQRIKTLVLLRCGDVGLVVQGVRLVSTGHAAAAAANSLKGRTISGLRARKLDEAYIKHECFFYNEHTCPTNFLPDVKAVINLRTGHSDPHGIFEYVRTIPYSPEIEDPNLEFAAALADQFDEKKSA